MRPTSVIVSVCAAFLLAVLPACGSDPGFTWEDRTVSTPDGETLRGYQVELGAWNNSVALVASGITEWPGNDEKLKFAAGAVLRMLGKACY